jgi:hypothetical protein
VNAQKAEQLDKVFKHLKKADGAKTLKANPSCSARLDRRCDVLSKLDESCKPSRK